jgi:hypothetical protein
VAGSCEYGEEPAGSGATELGKMIYAMQSDTILQKVKCIQAA